MLLRLRDSLGITIVVVTHELLSIDSIADSLIFLHNGSLLYDGSYSEARQMKEGPIYDFFERTDKRQSEKSGSELNLNVETVR